MSGIIQLAGFARSGKDAVGQILVEHYGFRRLAYADKLKALALAIGLWDGREETKREPLVKLGKYGREILGSHIWIEALWQVERKNNNLNSSIPICVTDCRYLNEHEYAARLPIGFYSLWWIDRPGIEPQGEEAEKTTPLHDAAEYIVVNNGTLDDLREQVGRLLSCTPLRRRLAVSP